MNRSNNTIKIFDINSSKFKLAYFSDLTSSISDEFKKFVKINPLKLPNNFDLNKDQRKQVENIIKEKLLKRKNEGRFYDSNSFLIAYAQNTTEVWLWNLNTKNELTNIEKGLTLYEGYSLPNSLDKQLKIDDYFSNLTGIETILGQEFSFDRFILYESREKKRFFTTIIISTFFIVLLLVANAVFFKKSGNMSKIYKLNDKLDRIFKKIKNL